jgi:hypothetical protein
MLALKMAVLRPAIFNNTSRIPEPQPWIPFVLAWTQLEIEHNAETNPLRCWSTFINFIVGYICYFLHVI